MTTKVSDQCYDLRAKGQGQICMKTSFMAGWPLGFRLWCPSVSLSLSDWYPGSGLVLDCIDSWSLQPYLLCNANSSYIAQWKILIFGIIIAYGVSMIKNVSDCQYELGSQRLRSNIPQDGLYGL